MMLNCLSATDLNIDPCVHMQAVWCAFLVKRCEDPALLKCTSDLKSSNQLLRVLAGGVSQME